MTSSIRIFESDRSAAVVQTDSEKERRRRERREWGEERVSESERDTHVHKKRAKGAVEEERLRKKERPSHTRMQRAQGDGRTVADARRDMASILEYALSRKLRRSFVRRSFRSRIAAAT